LPGYEILFESLSVCVIGLNLAESDSGGELFFSGGNCCLLLSDGGELEGQCFILLGPGAGGIFDSLSELTELVGGKGTVSSIGQW